jgi:hypothetical protein
MSNDYSSFKIAGNFSLLDRGRDKGSMIHNVSNDFIWLFGHSIWYLLYSFSDMHHLLGALLEPSLPSRVEREETLNTPLWEGFWQDTDD